MRKIILFHMGYSTLSDQNFGSEISLLKLAKELSKFYHVFIASSNCVEKTTIDGIPFLTNDDIKFLDIDTLIISRYINVFLDITICAKKVYLWLHDVGLQPYWRGNRLTDNGKHLYKNVQSMIDKVVVLSEFQKKLLMDAYDISSEKIKIIGHGLSPIAFDETNKIKYRFIWTSDASRNLDFLLKIFPRIKSEFQSAELHIFRDHLSDEQKIFIANHSEYIKHRGFLPNEKIQEEFLKADVWLYPTQFLETYCLSALEAMRAGCLCITTSEGSLSEIVGERGVLLKDCNEEAIINILKVHFKTGLYKNKIKRAVTWANEQTLENMSFEWIDLFDRVKIGLFPSWETSQHVIHFWEKKSSEKWKHLKFVTEGETDYDVVLNEPGKSLHKSPTKTIVFRMEPKGGFNYRDDSWIEPNQNSIKYFANHNPEWHLSLSYDQLSTMNVEKTKVLSTVVSSMAFRDGHKLRIELIKYLDKNLVHVPFDIYGRDNNNNYTNYKYALPLYTKDEGILPYKYTINCENTSQKGYYTEKIIDAILGECLCFYWGCPNISEYIDSRAFISIDVRKPEECMEVIKTAIKNNEWEKRLEFIKLEKFRILNYSQMIPRLLNIIAGNTVPDIPTFVINLKRRKDRWNIVHRRLLDSGFERFERFEAVDGTNLEWNEELKKYFALFQDDPRYFISHSNNAGVFGCALSHIKLWEKIAKYEDETEFMIVEDDVIFEPHFAQKWTKIYNTVKEDKTWDMLFPGFGNCGSVEQLCNKVYENVYEGSHIYVSRTHCYVIRKSAAIKLLNMIQSLKVYKPIDRYLMDAFLMCIKPLFIYPFLASYDSLSSDIQGPQATIKGLDNQSTLCFVINLDGEEKRWDSMCKRLNEVGLQNYKRFSAIDGRKLEWNDEMKKIFVINEDSCAFIPHKNNAGIFGCAMSHVKIWEKICDDKRDVLLVLEDDAILVENFCQKWSELQTMMHDIDILFLGFRFKDLTKQTTGLYRLQKTDSNFIGGTHCYAITKKGALKILNIVKSKKIHRAIDWFLIDYFDQINAFCINPLLAGFDTSFESSIQGSIPTLKYFPMDIRDEYGRLIDIDNVENTEQELAKQYIKANDIVFELGARYGSVSCIINWKLNCKTNQVVVEPDERVWDALERNKKVNGCEFHIVKGFVSKKKFSLTSTDVCNGYGTTAIEVQSSSICSYTMEEIQSKYNLTFNVLVADCEGFLEIFFEENPDFYDTLRLVIFEADYKEKCDYTKIRNNLAEKGFIEILSGNHNVWEKF